MLRSGQMAALVAVSALTAAACGSSSKTASPASAGSKTPGGAASSTASPAGGNGYQAAVTATAAAEKGTNRPVDPTSRPAVKNKSIVVISAGQATSSSQVPSDGAVEAAKAIGWKVTLYDAKLNPSNYSPLIRQAIAAHADGIVLDSIDCQAATAALKEAKAANIALVPITAFDCTDPAAGNQSTGVYSAVTNFGPTGKNVDAFTESYGADQANYIIAKSQNKAKIIVLQDPEFTVLHYTFQGFSKAIQNSGGSTMVDTVTFTVADLIDGQLVSKVQAALLQHPDATWIKSPYTTATQLGIVPGLGANTRHVSVMGGEGYPAELDLIRAGKVTAVNIISETWLGWSTIDTMNSYFLGKPPADSGIGWTIADATHNLPASGSFNPPIDFKAAYQKAWGSS